MVVVWATGGRHRALRPRCGHSVARVASGCERKVDAYSEADRAFVGVVLADLEIEPIDVQPTNGGGGAVNNVDGKRQIHGH